MYARGMTVREIAGFLLYDYKVEVSADFISTVTDTVLEAVVEWQNSAAGAQLSGCLFRRAAGEDPR